MPSCRQFGIRITAGDELQYLTDVQIQRPRPPFKIARRQLGVSLTTGRCSMQDDVSFEKRRRDVTDDESDLANRLRLFVADYGGGTRFDELHPGDEEMLLDAADEIERLRREIARLQQKLSKEEGLVDALLVARGERR
jgi:transposase